MGGTLGLGWEPGGRVEGGRLVGRGGGDMGSVGLWLCEGDEFG